MVLPVAGLPTITKAGEQNEEDLDLIARITRGDESALSSLYDRYGRLLYTLVFRMLHSVEEAEDIVQQIFLQIWNKADSYKADRGSVYTWLVTITRNRTIDRVRSKGFKKHHHNVNLGSLAAIADGDRSSDPHSTVLLREYEAIVRSGLQSLDHEVREVLLLAYYQGYSQSEIAEVLDLPLGTVKTRMRKGILILRDILKETIE